MIILKWNDCEGIYFPPQLGKVSNFASVMSFAKTTEHLFINLKIYDRAFDMFKPYFKIKNSNQKRSKDHTQSFIRYEKLYRTLPKLFLKHKANKSSWNIKYMLNSNCVPPHNERNS